MHCMPCSGKACHTLLTQHDWARERRSATESDAAHREDNGQTEKLCRAGAVEGREKAVPVLRCKHQRRFRRTL